jgi:hypothetical protein
MLHKVNNIDGDLSHDHDKGIYFSDKFGLMLTNILSKLNKHRRRSSNSSVFPAASNSTFTNSSARHNNKPLKKDPDIFSKVNAVNRTVGSAAFAKFKQDNEMLASRFDNKDTRSFAACQTARTNSQRMAKGDDEVRQTDEKTASQSSASASKNSKGGGLCCDKCDGKHETDSCPYYKKPRDTHIDAQKGGWKKIGGGTSNLPGAILRHARVIRQPGDGSCLFHSMSYGIGKGYSASRLRSEICTFIRNNPNLKISETPLSDWVKWDSNMSCADYARKMSR